MTILGALHPVMETARLRLRPIEAADAEALHVAFSDPEVMRYMDCPVSASVADTLGPIERWMFVFPAWHATWGILLKETGRLIGMINYHHRDPWNQHVEVGFALAQEHWRHGLMSEALDRVLEYCFGPLGSHRVEATVHPENRSAMRLMERHGFRCEGGPLRQRKLVAGEYRDVMIYGLLKPEWLLLKAATAELSLAAQL